MNLTCERNRGLPLRSAVSLWLTGRSYWN